MNNNINNINQDSSVGRVQDPRSKGPGFKSRKCQLVFISWFGCRGPLTLADRNQIWLPRTKKNLLQSPVENGVSDDPEPGKKKKNQVKIINDHNIKYYYYILLFI